MDNPPAKIAARLDERQRNVFIGLPTNHARGAYLEQLGLCRPAPRNRSRHPLKSRRTKATNGGEVFYALQAMLAERARIGGDDG